MLNKKKILDSINDLPDNFSADDVIDRIILLEKVETGLDQIEKGHVISDSYLDKKLSKWLSD